MRSRRAHRRASAAGAVGIAVLVTTLVGCAGPDGLGPVPTQRVVEPATACGAASFSCALPFPSSRWEIPDASTATGVRLQVPANEVSPAILQQLGPRDEVAEAVAGADGFSPVTPVVLQLPDALNADAVPSDGGSVVHAIDLTSGANVPIRAEVSTYGTDERGAHNIVMVWPSIRFEYGHRTFVALTRGVRAADGGLASASPAMASAPAQVHDAAAKVLPATPWSDILAATTFTVRTQASITADVDRMAQIVRADDHAVRNIEVRPSLIGGAAAVSGQVRITDFRSDDGVISREGTAIGRERWIDFMLVLPERSAAPGGAPVVIYGHGITIMKETMMLVAAQNAARGYATIGIDDPNHGSRINEGGHILDLAYPALLGKVESLLLQGELDHVSLLMAIQHHLGSLDVLPRNWAAGTGGDGIADLDTSRVSYEGTSLGGVLGTTFIALAPEIEAAFLQVPGSGIMDTLFHGLVWEMFRNIVPVGAPTGETHVLTFFAQNLLDRADDANYLDRIRAAGTPLFLSYAVDDGIVGNAGTFRMIHELGLPMVGPQYGALPSWMHVTQTDSMPADGRGFGQIPTGDLYGNILKPFLTHLEFMNPISQTALEQWLDRRAHLDGLR